jgi:DNA repair exonuclease SbcCD ATPase subunit
VPPHARLRLVSDGGVTVDRLRRATEIAKTKFKPESVTFLNRSVAKNALEGISGQGFTENLRDSAVQEKLFKDYLHEYDLSEEELDRIISLNSYYNSKVDDDGVSRNISWRVIRVEWDNLFSYDHGNFVNYDKLAGVVGILGANYSGKSSAVAALLVAMFNSTSKNIRKSVNYINQNKDTARAKVALEVDGKIYTIERTLEKYVRRLHGAETIEARTDVNFTMYDPVTEKTKSMNGESRIDTDKNIRKIFGTMEDFLISSMSAQMDSTAFIDEGPTKRSEIMAKFLDLSPFAQKFKMAKEDASDLKADIKRFGGIDFDHDLEETKRERRDNARGLETIKSMLNEAKEAYEKNREGYINLENRIDSFEEVAINIHEVRLRLGTKNEKLSSLRKSREENDDLRTKEREMLDKIDVFLGEQFDVSAHQEDKRLIEKQLEALSILENNIQIYETEKSNEEVKTRLLKQVPCGPEFSNCQFIRDAYEAKAKIVELEKTVAQLDKEKESFDSDLEARKDTIDRYIKKHSDLQSRRTSLNESLLKKDTFDINMKMQISDIESEIAGLEEDVRVYEANRQMYSEIEELEDERDRMSSALAIEKADISRMESSLAELYTENGSFGRKIEQITTQKQEYERMQKEYSAYDLFMRCCHSKGISLEIIKRNLPAINQEIANILSNVVKFEIFLKNEEKRLEIYIKHPKYGPRPIETGSGSEKTIAAAAIRIALLNVSSLPKSNCFIMDEPGTELDPEHLENFTQILDLVKSSFDVVILISHIDALRDVVDQQIAIEKREGYAHIEM